MAKITPRKPGKETVVVKTGSSAKVNKPMMWWNAKSQEERVGQLLSTVSFLKEQQQFRYRQAAMQARLYSNYPLFGVAGTNMSKMTSAQQLPTDRPTLNVIQSCIDTLHSRITQSKPRPAFLTDDGDYKQRKLSKQLNDFVSGEFYQTKAYEIGARIFKDALILGDGFIKVFPKDGKVCAERRLKTELLIDPNDGMYGNPRQMYEIQLIDRSVFAEMFPKAKSKIERAEQAFPDTGADSSKTIADQIMMVEAWRLPSGKDTDDGLHVIACSDGEVLYEVYKKQRFPFVKLSFSERLLGYDAQGLAEQLTGTQIEINKLLMTISRSINLVGVPRIFVEDGSKVVKAHFNNDIGSIITYRGTKPMYEVAQCVPQEVYAQLQRLVDYAYQQSGVSALAAAAQKPQGLNSGEAIRNYDDLQTDRFAAISQKYARCYEELADLEFDCACDIAEETGGYQTVYPNKTGAKEIDLPDIKLVKQNPFVVQCFDTSSLPKDPAGRLQKITEMIQAGMIDIREGRRLLDYPDLQQDERLANASEERILQILDKIVEEGKYTPPDPFMDLALAKTLSVQYYNLYVACKLEEEKAELLRTFNSQVQAMLAPPAPPQGGAMPDASMAMPGGAPPQGGAPIGVPQARPTSDLLPIAQGVA